MSASGLTVIVKVLGGDAQVTPLVVTVAVTVRLAIIGIVDELIADGDRYDISLYTGE